MQREEILHRVVKQAATEDARQQILQSLPSEFSLVEEIVDMLAQHWHEIPRDFAESMVSICVALICNGRRDRRLEGDFRLTTFERRTRL